MCTEKHDCLKGVHQSLIPAKCYKCGFVAAELKATNPPVPQVGSKDLLSALHVAKTHAEKKKREAKDMSSLAKKHGRSEEEVAWNHTYLAYEDMLIYLRAI
jgi:hypothetical protein